MSDNGESSTPQKVDIDESSAPQKEYNITNQNINEHLIDTDIKSDISEYSNNESQSSPIVKDESIKVEVMADDTKDGIINSPTEAYTKNSQNDQENKPLISPCVDDQHDSAYNDDNTQLENPFVRSLKRVNQDLVNNATSIRPKKRLKARKAKKKMTFSDDSIPGHCLCLTNLPATWSEDQIWKFLVTQCKSIKSYMTFTNNIKNKKKIVLLRFETVQHTKEAFELFNDKTVEGVQLEVSQVERSESRSYKDSSEDNERHISFDSDMEEFDIWDEDPSGLYGLDPEYLRKNNVRIPLTNWVHVSNIAVNKSTLWEVMELAGNIEELHLTRTTTGYAKVKYSHPLEAAQAVCMLNSQMLNSRLLSVSIDPGPHKQVLPSGLLKVGAGFGSNGQPVKNIVRQFKRLIKGKSNTLDSKIIGTSELINNQSNAAFNKVVDKEVQIDNEIQNNNVQLEIDENIVETVKELKKGGISIDDMVMVLKGMISKSNTEKELPVKNIASASNSFGGPQTRLNTGTASTANKEVPGDVNPITTKIQQNLPRIQEIPQPMVNSLAIRSPNTINKHNNFAPPIRFNTSTQLVNNKNLIPSMPKNVPTVRNIVQIAHNNNPNMANNFPNNQLNNQPHLMQGGPNFAPVVQNPPFIQPVPYRPPLPNQPIGFVAPNNQQNEKALVSVNNLPLNVIYDVLCMKMRQCGDLVAVTLTTPGSAIVTYANKWAAMQCVRTFDKSMVDGHQLDVRLM